jgi:hypothetical protein
MTAAPVGAEVRIFVDLVARVAIGDVIETQTGRPMAWSRCGCRSAGSVSGGSICGAWCWRWGTRRQVA